MTSPSGRISLRSWISRRKNPSETSLQASYAYPEHSRESIEQQEEEARSLASLNGALASLSDIFPDVQPEVFREMLISFPTESLLYVVTEALIKSKDKWVKGRWRVPTVDTTSDQSTSSPQKPVTFFGDDRDSFRSSAYKDAVKAACYNEFRGLSHSSIKAVLAEYNYSYVDTRSALLKLASKSWRYSFTSLVTRRAAFDQGFGPLIGWRSSTRGLPLEPVLLPTACKELDDEIQRLLVTPIKTKQCREQVAMDQALAVQVNEDQAISDDASYECGCCFSSSAFESIAACSSGDHFICFSCVQHTVSEALYGQGWMKNVDVHRSTLKCIAAGSDGECQSYLPSRAVQRALELAPESMRASWEKFEERTVREALGQARLPMNQCPHCMYAELVPNEIKPIAAPHPLYRRPLLNVGLPVALAFIFLAPYIIGLITLLIGVYYLASTKAIKRSNPQALAVPNLNDGQKFICRNQACLRVSCLRCTSPWTDVHACHQSSRRALRIYIESAITDSIKRTCPKCNLSFVKASGCNKLVCVCGYSMCYICRQDISKDSYSHFCPHFRLNPGDACHECTRCDLYRTEDDEEVIAKARERAIAEWKEQMQGKASAEEVLAALEEETGTSSKRPRSPTYPSLLAAFKR